MWLGSLGMSMGLFLSPFIVAFCRRKSTRLTAVFGGLTAGLGCLFTSFALQMHQVFLSYGFIMSVGLSCARITSSLMIGQYFKRRREKVEIIVTSGTGCGVVLFSYCFPKIIRTLGWRLGLHAITGLAVAPFFIGICFRSASLYHPQRRAILHLKNQRKKIKDKSGGDKPPFFDWAPLRSGGILISMLAAGLCGVGLYSPFFHLVPLMESLNIDEESVIQLQFHLGSAFMVGCVLFGYLLVRKSADCIIGRQHLCQTAMVAIGLSFLTIHTVQNYSGFVLFTWMFGVPCGGLHYSLKMLVSEKVRAKSFSRAWSYVEWAQSLPVLIGVPATGYMNESQGPCSGFYLSAAFSFVGAAALSLNGLLTSHHSFMGSRRAQSSCSTCTSQSQSPSCCCAQDFNMLPSRRESSANHPKCQKTISFSDTVDVADIDSPKRYQRPNSPPHNCNATADVEAIHDDDEEGNVDVDLIDPNMDIFYEDFESRLPKTVVVIEHRDPESCRRPTRYVCGHYDGELDDEELMAEHPIRQMTVIEEVTSSV